MLTFFLLPRVDKKYYNKKYNIIQINSILLLSLSRFAVRNVFPSVSCLFSQQENCTVLRKGCASSRPKAENL